MGKGKSKYYKQYKNSKYKIYGYLTKTQRTVKPVRVGKRRIMKDEKGQLFVKINGIYWKFPEEVDY